ncbi:peptidylprolyl isomerase [Clostridium frigidicarnis]|uniref:Peptidyl-prolyl cis-trans isomerase C n=1 Tax=Clostridium frigidicarnis TaxID=84698 RepID=A0A1I1B6M2_9CLOT|nr:peptidylprolyl isomerase [Clostridium frigidicarnis]SFB45306.1 peptidyl-prolyl cis-trans isomerase C [Clostridium frigidicarnis]
MENKILAIVNGAQIKESDLEAAIMRYPAERRAYLQSGEGKQQLLDQMISFELMYNYGKELGLENNEEYMAQLERAKKDLLTQTVINKELSEVKVNEEEIKTYYENGKDNFREDAQVRAKHILVETEEEANNIAKEIEAGLAFEDAALKHSKCPSSQNGGDLGFFGKGSMVPEFEEVAFSSEVNTVSAPIKTQFGYHLVKVVDKKEAREKSLEEVKDAVERAILQEKQNQRYFDLTKELKNKFKVEVYK